MIIPWNKHLMKLSFSSPHTTMIFTKTLEDLENADIVMVSEIRIQNYVCTIFKHVKQEINIFRPWEKF